MTAWLEDKGGCVHRDARDTMFECEATKAAARARDGNWAGRAGDVAL